jgi:PTS system ascorbate-specific IIC component
MLGIVAFLGLLLQRKSLNDVLTGTVKTMAGVIILFIGVDVLVDVMSPLASMFSELYALEGSAAIDFTAFLGEFGPTIVMVMVAGFLVNVLLARFTPLKYVFLTGHILFWNAFMITAALADSGQIRGILLIVIGSLLLGIVSTVLPALIAPFVRQLTGSSEFTIGHTTTGLALLGAYIGTWFGDKSHSTEDLNIPEAWSFMKEMVISTSIVMVLLYFVLGVLAAPAWTAEQFAGGSVAIWVFWNVFQGLSFGAGLVILLTGVRMMLAEIVPAFHGIANTLVPNAIPALDCPLVFPYAPNALTIGFPIAIVTSLITLVIFGLAGFPLVLLPLVVAAFFDVGPAAVLANATGGVRGAVLASAVGGVLLIVLQAASLFFVANTAAGFINAFGGNDFSLIAIVIGGVARLLGF